MSTTLQFWWAPNTSRLRSQGRPDKIITPPVGPSKIYTLGGVTAANTFSSAPATFVHPGILLGEPQLSFVKDKLADGLQPWAGEYTKLMNSKCDLVRSANNTRLFTDLSWVPSPRALIGRGANGGNSEGDHDEQADAIAAYANALRWYYTGNRAAAQKAIEICNAWSSTLQDHKFDQTTYSDGLLQSGWIGALFPRSAEIIRYTFTPQAGETALDVAGFKAMLIRAYIPRVKYGWTGGGANWLAVMAEATMACAIFNDDTALFARGCTMWRNFCRSSMWLNGDVNQWPQLAGLPISPRLPTDTPAVIPAGWSQSNNASTTYDRSTTTVAQWKGNFGNPTSWPDGLQGEMGRDPWHMAMGFAATVNGAEIARVQGVDLWGEQEGRIAAAVELACTFIHNAYVEGMAKPYGMPYDPASATFSTTAGWGVRPTDVQRTTWGIAYNHLHNRRGRAMTNNKAVLDDYVAGTGYRAVLHIAYENLTHTGAP